MWGRVLAQITAALLKRADLSNRDRQLLTTAVLERLHTVPTYARLTVDEDTQTVFIDGKPVGPEQSLALKEGAVAMARNAVRNLVRERVWFDAIHLGINQNLTPEEGLFAKAALWCLQEEDKLYLRLGAGE